MAILVTGGAGYIGSVTVDDLRARGETVVVLDNLSRGHKQAVAPEVRFYDGNIGDAEIVKRICGENQIDAAMHFSAFTFVGESVEKPAMYYENNAADTKRLLDALLENKVDKFVFSSTAAVFGEPEYVPVDEKHRQLPQNPYGWSKYFVEQIMRDYDRAYNLKFVSLRYFNACGATATRGEDHDPETHLIPLILQAAAGIRPHISIFGNDYPTPDGTAIRDYIHVSDLSQAHLLAVKHLQTGGQSEFVNLGNGTGFSVSEVIESARRVTKREIKTEIVARRAGDPSRLIADSTKARTLLGWQPQFADLDKIIESAWTWMQNHPRGYE